jgi:hypothetical protein
MKSLFSGAKIRPTTSGDFKRYSFYCACGALWNAYYLYRILQWSYFHEVMDRVDPEAFCSALKISYFGPPELYPVPVLLILVQVLAHLLFWGGSSIILADYSRKIDEAADGFRLMGFLFLGTVFLDIMTTGLTLGHAHQYFMEPFSSLRRTLINFLLLSVVAYSIFPWRKARP